MLKLSQSALKMIILGKNDFFLGRGPASSTTPYPLKPTAPRCSLLKMKS